MFLTGNSADIVGNYILIEFDVCERIVCINITITDDNIPEKNDMVFVDLETDNLISHNISSLYIELQDDDYGK